MSWGSVLQEVRDENAATAEKWKLAQHYADQAERGRRCNQLAAAMTTYGLGSAPWEDIHYNDSEVLTRIEDNGITIELRPCDDGRVWIEARVGAVAVLSKPIGDVFTKIRDGRTASGSGSGSNLRKLAELLVDPRNCDWRVKETAA